jgi:putative MATE family efflux protein
MTEGSPAKLILAFSVPMFIGSVFQQIYNMADSAIVGRFVGPNALAAVGTSFPVIFLLASMLMGLTMGAGVIISQFFGAKQMDKVRRAISTALIFQMASGVVLSILGLLFSRPLLVLLQTPAEIINDSATYMRIFFGGLIFMFGYYAFAAILRSLGDSKTPLYFMIFSNVVNIALDIYFVASLGWGVAGVAWATLIAQALAAFSCGIYVYRKVPLFKFSFSDFVFDLEILKTMVRIGIPTSLQQTFASMGMMAVQALVNSFGPTTMAAFTAAGRMDSFAMMPIMNFGMAISTYTGQNVGANNLVRVSQGLRATLIMVVIASLSVSLLVFTLGPQLIQVFISADHADVITQGVDYMRTVSIFYVLFGILMVTNGVLRGAGDAMIPMITTITSLVVRVTVAYWLANIPGIGHRGIWWGIPAGWALGSMVPVYRYLSGAWKEKAVVRQQMFERDKNPSPAPESA